MCAKLFWQRIEPKIAVSMQVRIKYTLFVKNIVCLISIIKVYFEETKGWEMDDVYVCGYYDCYLPPNKKLFACAHYHPNDNYSVESSKPEKLHIFTQIYS